MKIVILGAGQVGSTVAESLVSEANDITVVDIEPARLKRLHDRLDLRTVTGNAAHPAVLEQAGARDADMLLAVTQSDETNMVACKLAATMFNIPTKIARIRSADYLSHPEIFSPDNFAVDHSICPEQILCDSIAKLLEFPESLQVLEFADGMVSLVAVRAFEGGPLVGREIQYLRQHMPQVDTRVAAIFRGDSPVPPEGTTVVQAGDEVFFIAATGNIRKVLHELRRMDKPVKRVMIGGGGNIGRRLAHAIEDKYDVKIIEYSKTGAERLAAELDRTLVLTGDVTDEELLDAENVADMDVYCAVTNDDENNIMSSLLAKRKGASKVIALINRGSYVNLVQSGQIDIAISPAQATIGTLLAHVRRGDCAVVHSLRRGAAEALELIAHGDAKSSKVVGRRVEQLDLPRGVTIGAIVRHRDKGGAPAKGNGSAVIIAHHDTVIESDDHVIVFVVNKRMVPSIEKLFQVRGRATPPVFAVLAKPMSWLLAVCPVLGIIAMAMSLSHLLPVAVAMTVGDGTTGIFLASMTANLAAGALLWLTTHRAQHDLQMREGVLLIILVWVGGALFAAAPLYFGIPGISFTDAYFESMSGLTATGATLLEGLDRLPPSINVWRAELQWLGGMGVIVLVVAVLPMIGVGGRQISKAEIPGPMKDESLTPRMTQTAKGLWIIYVVLTAACLLAYRLAGMSWLDALIHSFTTLSLGGFSSHEASLGFFDSPVIEGTAMAFMLLAGINFATHFLAWQRRSPAAYQRDLELPYFLGVLAASAALVAVFLWANGTYPDWLTTLRHAAFHVVSVGTNTGFATTDYNVWPVFAPLWLMFLGTFVACSGSAGGGIKMIRAMILYRQLYREFIKLSHPNAVNPLKIGPQVVPNQVVFSVLAFLFAWLATLVSMTLLLTLSGLDAITAFSAIVASLNNIGPGLHQVGPATTFAVLNDFQTWICTATMLLGRLELLTVLVVLTPAFWRK